MKKQLDRNYLTREEILTAMINNVMKLIWLIILAITGFSFILGGGIVVPFIALFIGVIAMIIVYIVYLILRKKLRKKGKAKERIYFENR